MNATKIVGILLIIGGVLGLVYGSFSFPKSTKETHTANIGSLSMSITEKEPERVNVPVWVGVTAIVVGGVLLVFDDKKK